LRHARQVVQGLSNVVSACSVAAVVNGSVPPGVRIGELSRRVGVSPHVLRAWERRYGLLDPVRSHSGQRLYTPADESRVRRMRELMAEGFSAQVAARSAGAPPPAPALPSADTAALEAVTAALDGALMGLDATAAHTAFDRLLAGYALDTVMGDAILPLFARIGDRWACGDTTVAQEHFASALVAGRLQALTRGWDRGSGPRAIAACPPGERHDLGLLCFALALRDRGWRIAYLGQDTPVHALADTAARLAPDLVVLSAVCPKPLAGAARALAELARAHPLAIGGHGASRALAERLNARLLPDGVIASADAIAA
jgi:MerR family transcriptional regulator, light-induced transcriptional regulator